MSVQRTVPTLDDLRVKLCYICREEENHDAGPEDPPRRWTHPCKCTLIAHESCLLHWISTAQANPDRRNNALKCPQCGSKYELTSDRSGMLNLLNDLSGIWQKLGRCFTLASAAGCVAMFSSGVYIIFTGFGAYAFKQIVGNEMFDIMLAEDPSKWPPIAFFNLPLLTVSLIMSRFHDSPQLPIVMTSSFFWPVVDPAHPRFRFLERYWKDPRNEDALLHTSVPRVTQWPPSPMTAGLFLFPFVTTIYRRLFNKLEIKLLGAPPKPRPPEIQVRIWFQGGEDDRQRRRQEGQQGQVAEQGGDPDAANLEAAANIVDIDSGSIGRRLAGAILIPAISKGMGNILYRLSRHSPLLRRFLGVRPPLHGLIPPIFGPFASAKAWENLGLWSQLYMGAKLSLSTLLNGPPVWTQADPVWWRNAIGFGLFVVAKDCTRLLHLWLTKRDLESRHIKDNDFSGIDVKELDLIPSWNTRPRTPTR